jgi:hypothetical protein
MMIDAVVPFPADLPRLLGVLRYPGFAHLAAPGESANPADVVLAALSTPSVPARVVEALPWVLIACDLDWRFLIERCKVSGAQNRLGFLVNLARQVAEQRCQSEAAARLHAIEFELEVARSADENTLGRMLTDVERAHVRMHRSASAAHWNLLTNLRVEDLRWATVGAASDAPQV